MIDNVVSLLLIVLSFVAVKKISDSYNGKIIEELQFQIRKHDIQQGIGYVARPVSKQIHIGQEFMDKLKTNGRATQAIRTPQT